MSKKYGYRDGYSIKGLDPDDLGNILEDIARKNGGLIATKAVKETARNKKHILHKHVFDKPVGEAAEAYYDQRAMYITRSIYVIVPERPTLQPPMAINLSRTSDEENLGEQVLDRGYRMIGDVLADPNMRQQMLNRVWDQLTRLQRLYGHLTEYSAIWDAIAKTEEDRIKRARMRGKSQKPTRPEARV